MTGIDSNLCPATTSGRGVHSPKEPTMNALISTTALSEALARDEATLLDATFTMPGATPDAAELYAKRHIPGAIFFDVDAIADPASDLPHMLPTPDLFGEIAGAMGITRDTPLVIYDSPGLMSAGRAFWMFTIMGHRNLRVLDGGLKAWMAEGRPVTTVIPRPTPAIYVPQFDSSRVRSRAEMLANAVSRAEQVIDARSADRFHARQPEPRPVLRGGHIPGSLNLPFDRLSDPETGRMKSPDDLRALFFAAGLQPDQPVVTSCGSGVTAGALFFALHLIGRNDTALYDGSWTEWGLPGDTPVEV